MGDNKFQTLNHPNIPLDRDCYGMYLTLWKESICLTHSYYYQGNNSKIDVWVMMNDNRWMIIIKEKCWCSQGFMDQDGKYGKDEILMYGYEEKWDLLLRRTRDERKIICTQEIRVKKKKRWETWEEMRDVRRDFFLPICEKRWECKICWEILFLYYFDLIWVYLK